MKRVCLAAIASLLVLALFGCATEQQAPQSSGNAETGEAQEGEVVIRYWSANDLINGEDSPGMRMIRSFNEANEGKIRVEARYAPWTEHNTAIQAALSSGDMPDLFEMPQGSDLNKWVSQGLIRPVDDIVSDEWKSQFYEGSFMEGVNVIDGNIYTWPFTGPALNYILHYNKDVMADAGLDPEKPPKTWDELRAMAKTVTDQGKGDVFGVIFAGGQSGWTERMIEGFAITADPAQGPYGFNYKQGKYTLDAQAVKDSVNLLLALKSDNSIFPSSYSMTHTESYTMFGSGKAAFLFEARWGLWQIKRDVPDANFGLAAIPTPNGEQPYMPYNLAPVRGMAVAANTEHAEEVGKFIEEGIASEAFYKMYMENGVALAPFEALNGDASNHPYPEFTQFVDLHETVLREAPSPVIRNPNAAKVLETIGTMQQSKIKPTTDELLLSILMGAEKDIDGKLAEQSEKLNNGLLEGIQEVKASGVDIGIETFTFPDWDPTRDFTQSDYEQLK